MNLYLIDQEINSTYDSYDSAVVAADNEQQAQYTHPDGKHIWYEPQGCWTDLAVTEKHEEDGWGSWVANPKKVRVQLLGKAREGIKAGVILASFNAG